MAVGASNLLPEPLHWEGVELWRGSFLWRNCDQAVIWGKDSGQGGHIWGLDSEFWRLSQIQTSAVLYAMVELKTAVRYY